VGKEHRVLLVLQDRVPHLAEQDNQVHQVLLVLLALLAPKD
jgi:hypothetical protein